MVKSVFQIMIVALNKTLGRIKPKPFGAMYILVFVAYFIFLCKEKPFNYNRFCLWERISCLGVIWITTLTVINVQIEDESQNLSLLNALFVGWLVMVLVGNVIMRKYSDSLYPSFLHFHKSEEISDMIRFQFLYNSSAEQVRVNLDTKCALQQYVRQALARSPSSLHARFSSEDTSYQNNRGSIRNESLRKPLENFIKMYNFDRLVVDQNLPKKSENELFTSRHSTPKSVNSSLPIAPVCSPRNTNRKLFGGRDDALEERKSN